MLESQEPKYRIDAAGRIVNRQSGEAIPDDEPVMIFRARDKNAAPMIAYYRKLCSDPLHKEIVGKRLHHFIDFLHEFPERMKEPDSQLGNQPAPQSGDLLASIGAEASPLELAAKLVLREALNNVELHPCDDGNDALAVKELSPEMQALFHALTGRKSV